MGRCEGHSSLRGCWKEPSARDEVVESFNRLFPVIADVFSSFGVNIFNLLRRCHRWLDSMQGFSDLGILLMISLLFFPFFFPGKIY